MIKEKTDVFYKLGSISGGAVVVFLIMMMITMFDSKMLMGFSLLATFSFALSVMFAMFSLGKEEDNSASSSLFFLMGLLLFTITLNVGATIFLGENAHGISFFLRFVTIAKDFFPHFFIEGLENFFNI